MKKIANSAACGVWVFAITALASAALHPNHASLTEVEFNRKSNSFEVSLCVWPEDLAKIVDQLNGSNIELTDKSVAKHFPKYLTEKFIVRPASSTKSEPLAIRWVGAEVGLKKCWLYFELKTEQKNQRWKIENQIFFDLNDDQVNHCKIKTSRDQILWKRCEVPTPGFNFEIANGD